MITQTQAIKLIKEHYKFLSSEYGVIKIGIFGSTARNENAQNSDIDLIVELKNPNGFKFLRMIDYLENLLGTKVDVVTRSGLDNIRIKRIADEIKRNIVYV